MKSALPLSSPPLPARLPRLPPRIRTNSSPEFLSIVFKVANSEIYRAIEIMAHFPKKVTKSPSPFLTLPGEIRNHIYELCILQALKAPCVPNLPYSPWRTSTSVQSQTSSQATTLSVLKITALPRWSGPGLLRLEGIGSLPFLFASKQTLKEISTLLYSLIPNISIGGYILQYPGEDPSSRWEHAYALLRAKPDLLPFVKSVTVMLPYIREGVFRGRWSELNLKDPEIQVESKPWAMLPGLVQFLGELKALEKVKLVMTADGIESPDFKQLLGVYNICGHGTAIEVVAPHSTASWTTMESPWASRWMEAWAECLIEHGKI